MTMFKELESVRLQHGMPEHGLDAGEGGTVVHVHAESDAYDVEFVEETGYTKALVTLKGDQLAAWSASEAAE